MLLALVCLACERSQDAQPEAFQVGLLTPGSIRDAGWNQSAYEGLLRVREELGAEIAHQVTRTPQQVEEGFRDLAARGFELVFGHGFEFQDAAAKVGREYPDTVFITTSGSTVRPNVSPIVFELEQATYVLGYVGASISRRARLAAVGSAPPALDRRERWQIELLALASSLLAPLHPVRAVLADEKILRLAGARAPSPHLTGALVRLGEMHGDPEGDSFAQAGSLLEKHEFPHAQAAYFAAVGRCWLASGQLKRAKDNFAMALERFRRIGDPRGEAETVLSLIEADRVQGLCDDLIEQVAWLRRLTALLGAGALAEVSAGLEAYAGALAGQVPLATAGETMRSRAAGLDRLGDSVNACYLRALAGELALAAGDLSALLETVASAGDLRAGPLTAGAALLQGVMAEAHLVQANALPDEAEYHLQQARDLLASIAAYHAHSGGFPSYFARLEAMEGFVREELPAALDRAGQAISELKAQGARLPLGWLQYRIAEGLKARDDPQWLHWGGRALTTFDATRAHLYTDATRRLLELPAPLDDDLGEALALGEPPPHGAPAGGSAFAGLLERLGGGGIVAPEQLHTEILRQLVSTADAEYGGLLQPDSDGHLTLLAQVPEDEAPVERFNGWLAESVWREGQGEVLENYQPSSTVVTASDFPGEAQSLICVPIAIRERTFAVVMLGSAMSRLVFDQTHLHRLSALGREAGIVLALDETLRRADGERVRLAAETSRQAHLLAWSVRAAEGDTQALLASYLTQTADCGPFSGALLCLGSPDGAQLEFAAWQGAPRQLASLDAHLPLPLAGGQAGEALRRQVPVPIHAVDRPPPSESEQRLLNAIGASDGIWLPLLHGGEAFGVVLLAAEEPGSGSSRQWEDGLFAPLRLITPALQKALQVEAHGREQAQWATEKQVVERERDLYRRFIPSGLGTTPAELEGSMAEGVERTLPVLIGEAPGLAGRLGLGKRELLTTVQRYFERVEQGLVLHQGVLDRIQHRQWIAHFAGDADGALWGAQTLHQMLLALRDEGSAEGIAFPPTGLGLHLGNTLWGALAAGARLVPLLTGAGIRTATRLAAMSISFRCGILVSQATVEALQEPQRFDLRQLGKLRPAPGESRIEVYELYSVRDEEVRAPMRALQGVWEEALRHYQLGQWRRAAGVFGHYLARLPQDRPARFFLRQCRQRAPG
ncbi:MAG: BMP family ABC transporter substrate-binding protein [SAR324 cluster bacterium]|nr:BMP family ABC transporter substrate-binding protein [SAR324 cluster bacterium]